jgi:hypothetical protein
MNIALKPVEKLYLISKEDAQVYSKKNILYCLIYQLLKQKNLSNHSQSYRISFAGESLVTQYEEVFLQLLNKKHFIELDNFINTLTLDKTLVDYKILEPEIVEGRMFFFFKVPKSNLKKTAFYFELQAAFNKLMQTNPNILTLLCEDHKLHNTTLRIYNKISEEIQKAYMNQRTSKKKDDVNFEDLLNMDDLK